MRASLTTQISPTFSGHETFTLRTGWLKKAFDGVSRDPQLFGRPDAMVTLGVGKNMVRSMRHWAKVLGIVEDDPTISNNRGQFLQVSEFGRLFFGENGIDPFLEKTSTLWVLQFQLVSNPSGPTLWYWMFNQFPDVEFTSESVLSELNRFVDLNDWKRPSMNTLERDFNCFIRTYIPPKRSRTVAEEETLDCPLNELRMIHALDSIGAYAFSRGYQRSLSPRVFAYALLKFWNVTATNSNTLSSAEITYNPGSPGKVFKLSESAVVDYMREMDSVTRKAVVFDSTAGLVQLYRQKESDPLDVFRQKKPRRKK